MKTTIKGWITRDKDGAVTIHHTQPERYGDLCWISRDKDGIYSWCLPAEDIPELTWEDEPRRVTITIEEEKDAMAELKEKIELYAKHREANGGSIKDVDKYLRELRGYEEE